MSLVDKMGCGGGTLLVLFPLFLSPSVSPFKNVFVVLLARKVRRSEN